MFNKARSVLALFFIYNLPNVLFLRQIIVVRNLLSCLLVAGLALYILSCGKIHKVDPIIIAEDYKKGESLFNEGNDSAFYYFNRSASRSTDSLQVAMAYTYMAIIQAYAGDNLGSQENLLQALKLMDENNERDHHVLLSCYNQLANANLNMKNYEVAITYYDKALKLIEDKPFRWITLNGKAVAYQKLKQYDEALAIYHAILNDTVTNPKEYARIITNRAYTGWLKDAAYPADREMKEALRIREREEDQWGLNTSYARLADYYAASKPDSALVYAGKMLAIAKQLNSPDDELEALQKLIPLSAAAAMKQYFERYHFLNDSLQASRNNAKNQFALIRYESEKHKNENLGLQKENAEKKLDLIIQQVSFAGALVLAVIAFWWYRKRKQQAIREQQFKTSQKVHDVVANGLYSIITKIEHHPQIQKDQLLDDLETLYDRSRDISYEPAVTVSQDYHEEIASLLSSFSADNTAVSIAGNTPALWSRVSAKARNELKHILQELMVNMKKHSAAQNVGIRFMQQEKQLEIRYTDDGVGLPQGFNYGNGLTSTENRIKSIGGHLSFGQSASAGLTIHMFIPIA